MKLLISLLACAALPWLSSAAEPLSEAALQEIITEAHSPELEVPELKIYPKARKYSITLTSLLPDRQSSEVTFTALERWVGGKYIVSENDIPGGGRCVMVVDYDADARLYRKHVLFDGRLMNYQVGMRVGESRTVSWLSLSSAPTPQRLDSFGLETHTDTGTTWDVRFFRNGKLERSEKGVAKVVK